MPIKNELFRTIEKKHDQNQCQKLHAAREYHSSFWVFNVYHIGSLTEKRREMASRLGNTEIFSKLYADVRANECDYETFLNKRKENNTKTAFKKVVALENTAALVKQKAFKKAESLVKARVIFEM